MPYERVLKAIYSYEPVEEEELGFDEDDLICILSEKDEGWFEGQLLTGSSSNGGADDKVIGLVPANYLEPLEELGTVKALYDYVAQEENELSFAEDEKLVLSSRLDSDWWLVRNGEGQYGLIPSNYVEPLMDDNSSSPVKTRNGECDDNGPSTSNDIFRTKGEVVEAKAEALARDRRRRVEERIHDANKKWSMELVGEGEMGRLKGKLYLTLSNTLIFVHGKGEDKTIGWETLLADIKSFNRRGGEINLMGGGKVKVILAKSDSKELERIINDFNPVFPTGGNGGTLGILTTSIAANQADENIESEEKSLSTRLANSNTEATMIKKYALYDYAAQDDDELSIQEGEEVYLQSKDWDIDENSSDEWIQVYKSEGGKSGLVPRSYLNDSPPLAQIEGEEEEEEEAVGYDQAIHQIDQFHEKDECTNQKDEREETIIQQSYDELAETNDEEPTSPQEHETNENNKEFEKVSPELDEEESVRELDPQEINEPTKCFVEEPENYIRHRFTETRGDIKNTENQETSDAKDGIERMSDELDKDRAEKATDKVSVAPIKQFVSPPPPPPLPSFNNRPTNVDQKTIIKDDVTRDHNIPSKLSSPPPPPPPPPLPPRNTTLSKPAEATSKDEFSGVKLVESSARHHPINHSNSSSPQLERKSAKEACAAHVLAMYGSTLDSVSKETFTHPTAAIPATNTTATASTAATTSPWAAITLRRASNQNPLKPTGQSSQTSKRRSSLDTMSSSLGKALPSRPVSLAPSSDKPNPRDARLWKDRTGQFQTEAVFLSYDQQGGQVVIHKLNGSRVKVPLELLGDRDIEFVARQSNLPTAALRARIQQKTASSDIKTSMDSSGVSFKVKGFDWLQWLIECGLDSKRAVDFGSRLVRLARDETWLDTLTRDRLREAVPEISDGDALLVMQGVTKRRLQSLERLGQEKLLQKLKEGPSQTGNITLNFQPNSGTLPQVKPTLKAPLQPVSLSPPPLPGYQTKQSTMVPSSAQSTGLTALAPLPQHRSLKGIPALIPQSTGNNPSLQSLHIEPQPFYREFSTLGMVPLPNGQLAQQHTTTQYTFRAMSGGNVPNNSTSADTMKMGSTTPQLWNKNEGQFVDLLHRPNTMAGNNSMSMNMANGNQNDGVMDDKQISNIMSSNQRGNSMMNSQSNSIMNSQGNLIMNSQGNLIMNSQGNLIMNNQSHAMMMNNQPHSMMTNNSPSSIAMANNFNSPYSNTMNVSYRPNNSITMPAMNNQVNSGMKVSGQSIYSNMPTTGNHASNIAALSSANVSGTLDSFSYAPLAATTNMTTNIPLANLQSGSNTNPVVTSDSTDKYSIFKVVDPKSPGLLSINRPPIPQPPHYGSSTNPNANNNNNSNNNSNNGGGHGWL